MTARAGRAPQVAVLGSAEPGSRAHDLAGQAGECLAQAGITLVSGCGSPATRVAAERALAAGGQVVSIVPAAEPPGPDWPATVVIPCGMGDARNLLMALAGDACLVIGGRAGTISEVCLAWLHHRPLLPLVGCGGWSDTLPANPPDERGNSPILPWDSVDALRAQLRTLGLMPPPVAAPATPVAVVATDVAPRARPSNYPEPFARRMHGREKRALGNVFGLANFGVNLTRLAPGAVSALRHAHSRQDEFVYVLQGRPTLHTDSGTTVMGPGQCAGFAAGHGPAHRLVNDTADEVIYLEVGDRTPGDTAHYPDDDLVALRRDGGWVFTRKDGTPY